MERKKNNHWIFFGFPFFLLVGIFLLFAGVIVFDFIYLNFIFKPKKEVNFTNPYSQNLINEYNNRDELIIIDVYDTSSRPIALKAYARLKQINEEAIEALISKYMVHDYWIIIKTSSQLTTKQRKNLSNLVNTSNYDKIELYQADTNTKEKLLQILANSP